MNKRPQLHPVYLFKIYIGTGGVTIRAGPFNKKFYFSDSNVVDESPKINKKDLGELIRFPGRYERGNKGKYLFGNLLLSAVDSQRLEKILWQYAPLHKSKNQKIYLDREKIK